MQVIFIEEVLMELGSEFDLSCEKITKKENNLYQYLESYMVCNLHQPDGTGNSAWYWLGRCRYQGSYQSILWLCMDFLHSLHAVCSNAWNPSAVILNKTYKSKKNVRWHECHGHSFFVRQMPASACPQIMLHAGCCRILR